nr:hypothetical protein BaRGS_015951 [Batillaria attramentaria]
MSYYYCNQVEPCAPGDLDKRGKSVPVYVLEDTQQLDRFLVIGTEGGTYYASEGRLNQENANCITRLIESGQGELVVQRIVDICKKGRTAKQNCALFSLALCCRSKDKKTKVAAYKAVCDVCSIPTTLFQFIQYMENLGKSKDKDSKSTGWGRGLRKAVSVWYNQFVSNPHRLAMLITKYRQRVGWTHRDLLRLSHAKPEDDTIGFILRYAVKGLEEAEKYYMEDTIADADPKMLEIKAYLAACDAVKELKHPDNLEDVRRVVSMIEQHDLVREHVAPEMLNSAQVWVSLLDKMPMKALIRNLNKMTVVGVLDNGENVNKVVQKLGNRDALRKSRVHPYSILVAWMTYRSGTGHKGNLKWNAVPEVLAALEKAFYAAFDNVTPTNKRILIAVDVSASMTWMSPKAVISPRVSSAAMMMITLRTETNCDVVGFSSSLMPLDIKKEWTLDQVISYIETIPMGGTDCSLPMVWAQEEKKKYDAFIIYTDSETWFSRDTPANALRHYRDASGIQNARLATVAMTSGGFTLADPADLNMLDMVGFDTEAPTVLQDFIGGNLYE